MVFVCFSAYRLSVSGAIGYKAIDPVDIGRFAMNFMVKYYGERLMERYKLTELSDDPDDMVRAAETLLREIRGAKLGKISFEIPPQEKEKTEEIS